MRERARERNEKVREHTVAERDRHKKRKSGHQKEIEKKCK